MNSKLEHLIDFDETLGKDALNNEIGMIVTTMGDLANYLIFEYEDRFEVYLGLYDEGRPPYRNILINVTAKEKETAQRIASEKLMKEAYGHLH